MIKSFLITLAISLAFALIGFASGGSAIRWFGIAFLGQYIFFFLYNVTLKAVMQHQINKLEIMRLNALDENKTIVDCAVCKEPNDVLININEINEFRCMKCGTSNSISVNISNYQKTEMLDLNNGLITEELIKKIKETDKKEENK